MGMVLSDDARRIAGESLGFVGVHMRRIWKRQASDHDDLFQEGCVALCVAAQSYCDRKPNMPFVAWAFPRIRSAIWLALHQHFTTIRKPRRKWSKGRREEVENLGNAVWDIAFRGRNDCEKDTVGHKLRECVQDAMNKAALTEASSARNRNPATGLMLRRISEENVLIDNPAYRTPVRHIGQECGVSKSGADRYKNRLNAAASKAILQDYRVLGLLLQARQSGEGFDSIAKTVLRDHAASEAALIAMGA